MIPLCVSLTALAAWLAVAPPARAFPARRAGTATVVARRRSRWLLVAWLAGLLAVVGAGSLGGGRGAALAVAGVIAAGTTVRVIRHHWRGRAALRGRAEVAHACSLLASQLRVGRVPYDALRSTAEDCPVLAASTAVTQIGGDPVGVWTAQARRAGHAGLLDLARAWRVSTDTGAPLAPALERVAEGLTEDTALRRVVAGELSAPRATGKIMAVLPALGVGIGYAIGGDPVRFLLDSPYGWACLVVGTGLAGAGVLWIEALARRAAEED